MSELKELLLAGFITCNSNGEGQYNVMVDVKTLRDAQKLHREIIKFVRLENKNK